MKSNSTLTFSLLTLATCILSACGGASSGSLLPAQDLTGLPQTPTSLANQSPIAPTEPVTISEDEILKSEDFLSLFTDPDGDTLELLQLEASSGSVELGGNGEIYYVPEADFYGEAAVSYTISDGTNQLSSTASIVIQPVNDAPIALNDDFFVTGNGRTVALNVLENDSDVDGDRLDIVGATSNSGFIDIVNNTIYYRSAMGFDGLDNINYTIRDTNGTTSRGSARINVSEADSRYVYLSWAPPEKRENGDDLFEFEIQGYEIMVSHSSDDSSKL